MGCGAPAHKWCLGRRHHRPGRRLLHQPTRQSRPPHGQSLLATRRAEADETVSKTVQLQDAWQRESAPTLSPNGFQLVRFEHGMQDFTAEDVESQMQDRFYPNMEKLLLQECAGATKVVIFNHTLRASNATTATTSAPSTTKAPVKQAHSDLSAAISPLIVRKLGCAARPASAPDSHATTRNWIPLRLIDTHPYPKTGVLCRKTIR